MRPGTRINGHASLAIKAPVGLPNALRGPVMELTDLRTNHVHRRQGWANLLLTQTCAEADALGTMLMLSVAPAGDVDGGELLDFYARHGFVPIQASPVIMARAPRRAQAA